MSLEPGTSASTLTSVPSSAHRVRKQRRRAPRSCEECRRRKVKCDQKKPCERCKLFKKICMYGAGPTKATVVDGARRVSDDAAPLQDTEAEAGLRFERKGFRQLEPRDPPTELESPDFVGGTGPSRPSRRRCTSPSSSKERELDELRSRVRSLERLLAARAPTPVAVKTSAQVSPITYADRDDLHRGPPEMGGIVLNKSRLFGQTHWMSVGPEFRKLAEFMRHETGSLSENEAARRLQQQNFALFQKCKRLAKSVKSSRPSRSLMYSEPDLPPKDFADQMVQLYVSHFESVLRILHIPSFLNEYDGYWKHPTGTESTLRVKIQLVVALGSALIPRASDAEETWPAARQSVYAAQHWVSGAVEKDRVSISGLQVQCLLILARQVLNIGGDLIWIAQGTLIRTAMQLGLHRDPKHFRNMTALQSEVRRRLWATILELNAQASLDAGMPPTLSFNDFDTECPSNVDDRDIRDSVEDFHPCPDETVTDASLQRFLLESLPARLSVLVRLNSTGPELTNDEVVALGSEINKACRDCSGCIKREPWAKAGVFQHNLADLFLRRFLLVLHRPLISSNNTNPLYYFCRKTSLECATALLSPRPDERFSHLLQTGGGIFKFRLLYVSLALASELLIDTEEQKMPSSVMQQPSVYRKLLIDSVKEVQRQLAECIRFGQTNVRLVMRLSVVLSHAEGADSVPLLQQRMAQSARETLERSYSAILAYSGLSPSALSERDCGDDDNYGDNGNSDKGYKNLPEPVPQEISIDSLDFNDIIQWNDFMVDDMFGSDQSLAWFGT